MKVFHFNLFSSRSSREAERYKFFSKTAPFEIRKEILKFIAWQAPSTVWSFFIRYTKNFFKLIQIPNFEVAMPLLLFSR